MTASMTATWPSTGVMSIMKGSDGALVTQTLAGDVEAFSELVRRHERNVYNLAYRFMRDAGLAEDMAQEAFLKAFRLLKGFRGESEFSTWLYRVTCSVCLSELERRKHRTEVELLPSHTEDLAEPGAMHGETEVYELIRRCVARLPERDATIIALYYLQEKGYEEIAAAMKIPKGTLKTWMHRARAQLRKIVEQELASHGIEPY